MCSNDATPFPQVSRSTKFKQKIYHISKLSTKIYTKQAMRLYGLFKWHFIIEIFANIGGMKKAMIL